MENIDIFADALNLEDISYSEGYEEGVADGSRAGRIDGRLFGLEKGFEKFQEMGILHGRSRVWKLRITPAEDIDGDDGSDATTTNTLSQNHKDIKFLPPNPRLEKHIETLLTWTDRNELSTANDEESVDEFDEQLKKAKSKVKIVERIVGEIQSLNTLSSQTSSGTSVESRRGIKITNQSVTQELNSQSNIEDFGSKVYK